MGLFKDLVVDSTKMATLATVDAKHGSFAEVVQVHLMELHKSIVAKHEHSVGQRIRDLEKELAALRIELQCQSSDAQKCSGMKLQTGGQNQEEEVNVKEPSEDRSMCLEGSDSDSSLEVRKCAKPQNCSKPSELGKDFSIHRRLIQSCQDATQPLQNDATLDHADRSRISSMARLVEQSRSTGFQDAVEAVTKGNRFSFFAKLSVDSVMGVIILLNIFCIGVSTDYGRDTFSWFVIDTIFAFCFLWEMFFKIHTFGIGEYFCGSNRSWNILDAIVCTLATSEVVTGMVNLLQGSMAEKGRLSTFRIFRLCRITRLIRLVRVPIFKDLLMMVNGMIGGMRTLFWSMVLILVPLYALALFMRETVGEEDGEAAEPFSSLRLSMFTVFRCVVSGDCSDASGRPVFLLITRAYGWHNAVIYCMTMLLMTFGLFNVIIALYVENTVAAAKHNDVLQRRTRLQDQQRLALKTNELVQAFWSHYNKRKRTGKDDAITPWRASFMITEAENIEITFDLFEEIVKDRKVQEILSDLDIPEEDRIDLFDILDADGNQSLILEELVVGITKLRGESRRSDIISVSLQVRELQTAIHHLETTQNAMIKDVLAHVEWVSSSLNKPIHEIQQSGEPSLAPDPAHNPLLKL